MNKFFDSLTTRSGRSTFFAPWAAREVIREQQLLPPDRTHLVAFANEMCEGHLKDVDFTGRVPFPMTVSQFCLMAAIYMGCSPIYLLGFDHDWLSHRSTHRHFYEGLGGLEEHPEVRPELKDQNYKLVMECALVIWRGYESLLELAGRKGIRIFDATNGGFLDVFEPANYEQLISESSSNQQQLVEKSETATTALIS